MYWILYPIGEKQQKINFLGNHLLTVFPNVSTYPFFNTYSWKTVLFLNSSPIYTAGDLNVDDVHQNKYKP